MQGHHIYSFTSIIMDVSRSTFLKFSLIVLLLALAVNGFLKWWWTLHGIIVTPLAEYDFIIVGGGTAGCALARRLWEGNNYSILVIEPGNTAPFISSIPLVAPALQGYGSDWVYKTEPQKFSHFGMKNRISAWPRGKVLGGSSVLNFMIHMWGTKADFDESWSSVGPEWRFDSVRPYFKKMENYNGSSMSDLRGTGGPMYVRDLNNSSPLASAFVEGALNLGLKKGDLNGELENGVMFAQSNILDGRRVSAFDAYLQPVLKISRIQLLINSVVVKVVFAGKVATAVDVVDLHTKAVYRVYARKEIILSAGVIGSPQILMLSGIGPKEHLEEHKIPVLVDLPGVGRNLHDHLNVPMYFHLNTSVSITTKKVKSVDEIYKYFFRGKGFLAHSGIEVITRVPVPGEKSAVPKMYFMLFRLGSVDESIFTNIANIRKDIFKETFPSTKNGSKEGFIIMATCTHPFSRGYVRLKSEFPEEHPEIDPKYLMEEKDAKCLVNAMKMAAKLGSTKFLRSMGSRLHLPAYKTCSTFNRSLDDDDYMDCWLRTSALTGYHPLGTCAMGLDEDKMAVLDSKLNVRGVKNLRVVDGSAFPHPIAGNPNAAILMLAEKSADLILKELQNDSDTVSTLHDLNKED